jgi:hypothetical protein
MAFSARVFCRGAVAPTLSELLVYLRQHEVPSIIVGGSSSRELLAPDWSDVALGYEDGADPLHIRCHHAGDPNDAAGLRAEVDDFLVDLQELPPSPARDRVIAHLRQTRLCVVVEFPATEVPARGYQANGWLMNLFVERADGLVQFDGVGFSDENDEIILRLG